MVWNIKADGHRATASREKLNLKHLQQLVAVVVDDLDGDFAGGGRREGAACGGVEGGPGGLVDEGPECPLELVVGLVGPGEIGVAQKEALAVIGGIDEPAGDVVRRA